jgi:hypothetical protein
MFGRLAYKGMSACFRGKKSLQKFMSLINGTNYNPLSKNLLQKKQRKYKSCMLWQRGFWSALVMTANQLYMGLASPEQVSV